MNRSFDEIIACRDEGAVLEKSLPELIQQAFYY